MLFGSSSIYSTPSTSSASALSPAPTKPSEAKPEQKPSNPLDLLFLNATRSSPQIQSRQPQLQEDQGRPKPLAQQQHQISGIPKTLEQLFAAASPIPQSASLPFQALSQAHLSAPSPRMLPNPLPKSGTSNENGTSQTSKASPGMSLLDAIFASASTGNVPVRSPHYFFSSLQRTNSRIHCIGCTSYVVSFSRQRRFRTSKSYSLSTSHTIDLSLFRCSDSPFRPTISQLIL